MKIRLKVRIYWVNEALPVHVKFTNINKSRH